MQLTIQDASDPVGRILLRFGDTGPNDNPHQTIRCSSCHVRQGPIRHTRKSTYSPAARVSRYKLPVTGPRTPIHTAIRKRCADQPGLACLARVSPYIDRSDAQRRSDALPLASVESGRRQVPMMQQKSNPDTQAISL
jgi:hypothetical protein